LDGFRKFYNEYWEKKEDEIDHNRLNLIVKCNRIWKKGTGNQLWIGNSCRKNRKKGCGIRSPIYQMLLFKSKIKGISKGFKIDIDKQQLPINLPRFDIVVSNSMIEHSFSGEYDQRRS